MRVFGVAYRHDAPEIARDLDAFAAVAAVAGLAPGVVYAFHSSSANLRIRSRDCPLDRASPRTRSKVTAALRTLSTRWGTKRGERGHKVVWAELAL